MNVYFFLQIKSLSQLLDTLNFEIIIDRRMLLILVTNYVDLMHIGCLGLVEFNVLLLEI
jgi:hypothetical protein